MAFRSRTACVAGALLLATAARAQTTTQPQVISLSAQASVVPLFGGDASVGRMTGIGTTLLVGAKLIDQMPYVEASYSFLPGSATTGKPRVQFFSVMAGRWFGSKPRRPSAFLGGGLGLTNYSLPGGDGACVPPECFLEAGPNFSSRSVTNLVGDAGVSLPLVTGIALRVDGRMHLPMERPKVEGGSGKTRFELAVGLRLYDIATRR